MPPNSFTAPRAGRPDRASEARTLEALGQAVAHHQRGDLVEAARLYKLALRRQPNNFDALHFLGLVEAQRGRLDKAERLLQQALQVNAASPSALCNLGNVQHQRGQLSEALTDYERALLLDPRYVEALNNRGSVLLDLGRAEEAATSFAAAVAVEPRFVGALRNHSLALRALRRWHEALGCIDQALLLEPQSPDLCIDRGTTLVELGRTTEAFAAFDKALALDPDRAEAPYNKGVALLAQGRFEEALASFDAALKIRLDFPAALGNRGNVLVRLGRTEEAFTCFDQATAIDPDFVSALSDRGQAALGVFRYDLAADSFERLVARAPDYPYALGNLIYARANNCDWREFGTLQSQLTEGVRAGRLAALPGQMLAFSPSAADQLRATKAWAADMLPDPGSVAPARRYTHDKIHLAYLSADFRNHSMPTLLGELFERHDRSRFETIAISFGPDDGSTQRARMTRAFDRFIDVREKSDADAAALLESLEADIAVDLMGHTLGSRPGIFMRRPANIQVNYLGYPGTSGVACIDYVIGDACLIPEADKAHYSECVVHLPDTYYVTDGTRPIASHTPSRADASLPEQGVVFCCFNAHYKITPDVFAVWMRLLKAIDGSVLWLLQPTPIAEHNLRAAAAQHGVDASRLVFAGRAEPADHLARHGLADLFLDTLPYNAHTTTCDTLYAGLPLVTCKGATFPSRVAASVLTAVGLPELITHSLEEYEALAATLARDPAALAAVREKLARQRHASAFFDTDRYRRHIEQAYVTMWERHQRGEPPASFSVPPLSA